MDPDGSPKGKALEDYAAALFHAAGYFVERNVVKGMGDETVLELDIVATDYSSTPATSHLIEVKSGGWGYPDLFKLRGWMTHLGISEGGLVVAKQPMGRDLEAFHEVAQECKVRFVCTPGLDTAEDAATFLGAGYGAPDHRTVGLWHQAMTIERSLSEGLRTLEPGTAPQARKIALQYFDLINNALFFQPSLEGRAAALYGAYRSHPKLTALAAAEMATNQGLGVEGKAARDSVLGPAIREGEHPFLQACMYLEHRARLAVLKTAVDFALLPRAQLDTGSTDTGSVLPRAFLDLVERLRERPAFQRYPLFWQVFLWLWGGLLVGSQLEREYQLLADQTGLPVTEVPKALGLMDELFPVPSGWFAPLRGSEVLMVKVVPAAYRGIGSSLRQVWNEKGFPHSTPASIACSKWLEASQKLTESPPVPRAI